MKTYASVHLEHSKANMSHRVAFESNGKPYVTITISALLSGDLTVFADRDHLVRLQDEISAAVDQLDKESEQFTGEYADIIKKKMRKRNVIHD